MLTNVDFISNYAYALRRSENSEQQQSERKLRAIPHTVNWYRRVSNCDRSSTRRELLGVFKSNVVIHVDIVQLLMSLVRNKFVLW